MFLKESFFSFSILFVLVQSQPILRYTENSCSTLEPSYIQENYASLNLGPDHLTQATNDDGSYYGSPKKQNNRPPPFELEFNFNEYRKNKNYHVRLVAFVLFDSFIIQARGQLLPDGNATFVGEFVQIPSVSTYLKCGNNQKSSVIDKGRPIEINNLTFTWNSPSMDKGPVRFIASVVYNDAYVIVNSNQIFFTKTPVNINDCGKGESCLRACESDPNCPVDSTDYILTMGPDGGDQPNPSNILFKLGGYLLPNSENYIGVGLVEDYYYLKNMDIVVCYRDGNEISLGHYFLEDSSSQPYQHRQKIILEDSGVTQGTGFGWCQFVRPISPKSVYDVDFTKPMYHFYLIGNMTQDMRIMLPPYARLQHSTYQKNISDSYNDIRYIGAGTMKKGHIGITSVVFLYLMLF